MNMKEEEKKYFQEDLNSDDGTKWHKMLSHVIDKTNFIQFTSGIVDVGDDLKSRIREAKNHVRFLGFSKNLIEIYPTQFHYQRMHQGHYIVVRLNLASKLKKKIRSYETLNDFALKYNDDIFDPAFYFNKTSLLWTVSSMNYANLLLTDEEKLLWQTAGFSLNVSSCCTTI